MIQRHLQNPFLNSAASDVLFGRLAGTHLERLKAANANDRYLSLIAATQPLYSAFMHSITAGIGTSADRKSKTVSTDEAVKAIKGYISRKEGVLADRFPRKSAEYQAIYPQGVSQYRVANKASLPVLTERFIGSVREHGGEAGRQIAEEAQALLDHYQTLRNGQLQAIGSAKGLSTDSGEKRKALAVQLYKNLLTLLLVHAESPAAVENFFDVSFLRKVRKEEVGQGV
jgi:hypothetical protein